MEEKDEIFRLLNTETKYEGSFEPFRNHRFLVQFGIENWVIDRVDFDDYVLDKERNKLKLRVKECYFGDGFLAQHCKEFSTTSRELRIVDLDPTGIPLAYNLYTDAKVESIAFPPKSYDDDGIRKVDITMSYNEIIDLPVEFKTKKDKTTS